MTPGGVNARDPAVIISAPPPARRSTPHTRSIGIGEEMRISRKVSESGRQFAGSEEVESGEWGGGRRWRAG